MCACICQKEVYKDEERKDAHSYCRRYGQLSRERKTPWLNHTAGGGGRGCNARWRFFVYSLKGFLLVFSRRLSNDGSGSIGILTSRRTELYAFFSVEALSFRQLIIIHFDIACFHRRDSLRSGKKVVAGHEGGGGVLALWSILEYVFVCSFS